MTNDPIEAATTEDSRCGLTLPHGAASSPYLFVVLHCDRPLLGGARYALEDVDVVRVGRGDERAAVRGRREGDRILDLQLPGSTISSRHARITRGGDGWTIEDTGSKNGLSINGERVAGARLRDGDVIEIGSVLLRFRAALLAPGDRAPDLDTAAMVPCAAGFATLLPHLSDQLDALGRVAPLPLTVLLLGETGTGKEVLARAVHALSGRTGPLIAVNCGSLPETLLESQLFGHVKGAFTGAARDELGHVRNAGGGTLFLDEIGDLPLTAQPALLRVLQEREVVPVGATRPVKVDLRVVAATNAPLDRLVLRGQFRGDLLARLSGYRHQLAPLRCRIEDTGLLVADLLARSATPGAREIRISQAAGRKLLRHDWPLNIRELEQIIAVAAALSDGGVIDPAHLPRAPLSTPPSRSAPEGDVHDPEELRRRIVALLERHRGKITHVARDMGKARMQIHRWMHRFGIDPKDYRG